MKLSQIAIALFVLNNTLFDLINIANSTKLSIVFFGLMYFCFLLFCVDELIKSKFKNSFSLVMGIGFTVRIIWELTKWNLKFDEYVVSVNNYEKNLLFSFLIIALILISISHERRNNKGH